MWCGWVEDVTEFCVNRVAQRSMGVERQRGLVGQGVTEEFYVKILQVKIMNSWKLFNYSSRVFPRTIDTAQSVSLFLGLGGYK